MLSYKEYIADKFESDIAFDHLTKEFMQTLEYSKGFIGTGINNTEVVLLVPREVFIDMFARVRAKEIAEFKMRYPGAVIHVYAVSKKKEINDMLTFHCLSNVLLFTHNITGFDILKKTILAMINKHGNVSSITTTIMAREFGKE